MKRIVIAPLLLLQASVLVGAERFGVDDPQYAKERLQAHTATISGSANPDAIPLEARMRSTYTWVRRGHSEDFGLSEKDASILASIDRVAVEEAAARPIWSEICRYLAQDVVDATVVALKMKQAERALQEAIAAEYRKALNEMSPDGRSAVESAADQKARQMTYTSTDLVGLSYDVPNFVLQSAERFCERHFNMADKATSGARLGPLPNRQ